MVPDDREPRAAEGHREVTAPAVVEHRYRPHGTAERSAHPAFDVQRRGLTSIRAAPRVPNTMLTGPPFRIDPPNSSRRVKKWPTHNRRGAPEQ